MRTCRVPGDEIKFNKKMETKQQFKQYFEVVLSFVIVFLCAIIAGWMVYNYFKFGSVFPVSVSQDFVSLSLKSFKGFKSI